MNRHPFHQGNEASTSLFVDAPRLHDRLPRIYPFGVIGQDTELEKFPDFELEVRSGPDNTEISYTSIDGGHWLILIEPVEVFLDPLTSQWKSFEPVQDHSPTELEIDNKLRLLYDAEMGIVDTKGIISDTATLHPSVLQQLACFGASHALAAVARQ